MSLHIAVVGLGFGAEFPLIYRHHPDVDHVTVCDASSDRLESARSRFGFDSYRNDLAEVLADPMVDAVHLVTGIPDHADQSVAVLEAGKHCACTVPMATSIGDIHRILAAVGASGKRYMMMETSVFHRAYLYVADMVASGAMGTIQFLRGAHYQDMENWPAYWSGLPPMWYSTHAVSPLLALTSTRAKSVRCLGSGTLRPELKERYGNPFPIETAIIELEPRAAGPLAADPLVAEVTRALFHSARAYSESFNVYGEDRCFEWQQIESERPVVFDLSPLGGDGPRQSTPNRIEVPDRADLLPEPIQRFTKRQRYDQGERHHSVMHGGGHGGSHPHLVHEFVRSIAEDRHPAIDAVKAAEWTAVGVCAHESAMAGGRAVAVPRFAIQGSA